MFKNLDPQDISIKPFKAYKNFTFTNNDSGSGVWAIKARSGSIFNYQSSSDHITTITSGSTDTNYFALPTWHSINKLFYKDYDEPFKTFGNNDTTKENRELHTSASIINVSRDLFGEEIKPGSIKLSDTSNGKTFDIRDDGDGNLYDFAFSSSFAAFKSSSFDRDSLPASTSGSQVGNVFYSQGLLVFTDTGSYKDVGFGTGYSLKYQSTQQIYEYEYKVSAKPFEFNVSQNISLTPGRSGSITLPLGTVSMSRFLPPGDQPSGQGTGSYATFYNAATSSLGFVTGSDFKPYVSTIGLYNENNELLVVGRLGKPIQLSDDIETSFIVRFDT